MLCASLTMLFSKRRFPMRIKTLHAVNFEGSTFRHELA